MFRTIIGACLLVATLAFTPAVLAGESEDLAELESLTGLTIMFDGLGEGLGASAKQVLADKRFIDAWEGAAKEAFVPAAMREEMFKVFVGAMSDDERSALLTFYRSDFGRKVSAMEDAVHGSDADPASIHDLAQSAFDAASPERRALIEKLRNAIDSEAGKQLFIESLRSMLLAEAVAMAHGDGPIPWDKIDEMVDRIAPTMLEKLDAELTIRGVYIYRDLSDAEVQQYMDFLGTAPAQKFYKLVIFGSAMVTDKAMTAMGTSFAGRLRAIGA